jgi:DNA-binding winged helix-turn-helix (wHTH) protein
MSESNRARFGAFELNLNTGELLKFGAGVRLQRRSFCVLRALLERHGEVVTREELRTRLWSNGTFVDFESGMNTAVNRLRSALGDCAEKPIYVETLARLGYRFVAPVTFLPELSEDKPAPEQPHTTAPRWRIPALATIAAALTLALLAVHASQRQASISYKQLTVSPGFVQNARFLHDGRRIVYSSISHGDVSRAFVTRADGRDAANPNSLSLPFQASGVAGVSPADEIALLEPQKNDHVMAVQLVKPDGSNAHKPIERGYSVDWARDGRFARIIRDDGWFNIEFPIGRTVYRSRAWLDTVRVSSQGDYLAFIEHPIAQDDAGQIMIVTPGEPARALSKGWESVEGLAWHPSGKEVWFTAASSGVDRKLWAVNLNGRVRRVAEMPGGMVLRDISAAGEVLIVRPSMRMSMRRGNVQDKASRDISLLDWSRAVAIAADGKSVLFDESGQGGGRSYSVYLYNADKDSAEQLGNGRAMDLSADGKWALTEKADDPTQLSFISVRSHKAVAVKTNGSAYHWARFLGGRDCPEVIAGIADHGQRERLIKQELPDGKPVPVLEDLYLSDAIVDEAGRMIAGMSAKPNLVIADLDSKAVRYLEPIKDGRAVAFGNGGRLITTRRDHNAILLESLDPSTGMLSPYARMPGSDSAGVSQLVDLYLAHDRQTFVYSSEEKSSILYLVSGWT